MGSSSNRKFAGLTAHKMGGLWQEVKLNAGLLFRTMQALVKYKSKYQAFRERWGNRPPRTDKEWLQFWREFVSLEDDIHSMQVSLMDVHANLNHAAGEGLELVRLNGIDDQAVTDPIGYMRRSLDRVARFITTGEETGDNDESE